MTTIDVRDGKNRRVIEIPGGFEILENKTVSPYGNGAYVGVPKAWLGRECVVVGILARTITDEPENEKSLRGM